MSSPDQASQGESDSDSSQNDLPPEPIRRAVSFPNDVTASETQPPPPPEERITSFKLATLEDEENAEEPLPPMTVEQAFTPYERECHDVFVELDELQMGERGQLEWKEKARWIKFEEDVQLGGEWGRPHVSSLSFHSLLDLRTLLEEGLMLFDMEELDLPSIVHVICQRLREQGTINELEVQEMQHALLFKHSHKVREEGRLRRVLSSGTNLGNRSRSQASFTNGVKPSLSRNKYSGFGQDNVGYSHDERMGTSNVDVAIHRSASRKSMGEARQRKVSAVARRVPEEAQSASVWVGSVSFLRKPVMVFARLAEGTWLNNVTEAEELPVRFIFILMGPTSNQMTTEDYHEIGRAISTLMSYKSFQRACYTARHSSHLIEAMNDFLDSSVVLPAGEWVKNSIVPVLEDIKQQVVTREKKKKAKRMSMDDELETPKENELARTGIPGGGLWRDVRHRYPLYLSDVTDCLHPQCLSVVIFIFFAALSPAITFGADIEKDKTGGWMGPTETILGSAISGAVFSLIAGQPLLIIGVTGPLAVFEGSLFEAAKMVGEEDYMALRLWVSVWILLICLLTAVFELSFLLEHFTRFTEEVFAMLVSLIYVVSALNNLVKVFDKHPLELDECEMSRNMTSSLDSCVYGHPDCDLPWANKSLGKFCWVPTGEEAKPNTALLSVILAFGCFFISWSLKLFRYSRFLGKHMRKALGDFGVPLGIAAMTIIDVLLNDKTYTEKLHFPDKFQPTRNDYPTDLTRDWFISPVLERWWLAPAALVPAIPLFFLVFIETQITSRIVNKPEHNLKKGTGYHLNILSIGLISLVAGLLGTPFVCAATVRCVTHAGALTWVETLHAPGEKPGLRVREQRVTAVLVQILLGCSILLKDFLKYVPYAALYGVFLYMGASCLTSLQFYERAKLLLMPAKHYPDLPYTRNVPRYKLHLFTLIQMACLAVLWVVKETPAGIAFPFFLMLLLPLRLIVLPKLYSPIELDSLDSEKVPDENAENAEEDVVVAHMPY